MIKLVLFNGPPRSGKDTSRGMVEAFSRRPFTSIRLDFKDTLLNSIDYRYILQDDRPYEDIKASTPELRKILIDFSEKVIKPNLGEDYFAKRFVETILAYKNSSTSPKLVLCADVGFDIEIDTILKQINPKDVYLIQLRRDGCSFLNDSRNYVKTTSLIENNVFHITNSSLKKLENDMLNIYEKIQKDASPKLTPSSFTKNTYKIKDTKYNFSFTG